MRHFAKHLRILAIGSVASIAFIGHGVAQDAQDSSLEESYQGRNDIIVTETRRSESVLDVHIRIAVLTVDKIGRRGLVNADDYLRGMPGDKQKIERAAGRYSVGKLRVDHGGRRILNQKSIKYSTKKNR